MEVAGKVIVVTGGGSGIGRALCRRFAREGVRGLVVADLDGQAAEAVAAEMGGRAVACDVSVEADNHRLVAAAEKAFGPVDVFCANAGVAVEGGPEASDHDWQRALSVNFMSTVHACRALLPRWLERGDGCLVVTASAAGVLTSPGAAPYAVSKHAAVAYAEWLSITYGARGIRVACVCPLAVRTPMYEGAGAMAGALLGSRVIEPEVVADAVVAGLAEGRFFIYPHPEVAEFVKRKADDHERWLKGVRRLVEKTGAR